MADSSSIELHEYCKYIDHASTFKLLCNLSAPEKLEGVGTILQTKMSNLE